jgi:hypothetical protein
MTDLLQKLQNGFGKTKSAQRQSYFFALEKISKHTHLFWKINRKETFSRITPSII